MSIVTEQIGNFLKVAADLGSEILDKQQRTPAEDAFIVHLTFLSALLVPEAIREVGRE
ncbi:hypothetical protein [Paenibacillus sp. 1P03SA]|uniref:hypothetical protein n=1 Tax=Paenibacillus sp. 1P03SA TaxID=3132294 RepID=UPI0039A1FE83